MFQKKKYPLPVIYDIMQYKYFTKLDISMQYYTSELNKESHKLCVIIKLFGEYKYKHLPMGLKCSPDFAWQIIEQIQWGLDNVEVYLDGIGFFGNTWEDHQVLLDKVLSLHCQPPQMRMGNQKTD